MKPHHQRIEEYRNLLKDVPSEEDLYEGTEMDPMFIDRFNRASQRLEDAMKNYRQEAIRMRYHPGEIKSRVYGMYLIIDRTSLNYPIVVKGD